ncbi:hypothetical protein AC1031_018407 [Aphanomyces cochlioides]|nr:hypothetical protein AC1031_018407 [Aphanomyces cochlioides]
MELSEERNAAANTLYKEGRYVDARQEYTAAYNSLKGIDGLEVNLLRSRILANRAQTYLQERDYGLALRDAQEAVECDPSNFKARMRQIVACENLEKFEAALKHVRALLKLPIEGSTLIFALTTQTRIKRNCKTDAAAAKAQKYDVGKLVHDQQSLRLNFGSAVPSKLPVGNWFDLVIFAANEFGLFQRGLISSPVPLSCVFHTPAPGLALEMDPMQLELGLNGKVTVRLRINASSHVNFDELPVISIRASVDKGFQLDDVLPVVTLPIQLTKETFDDMTVDPLGLQCCRCVYVDPVDKYITLAESPGNLGKPVYTQGIKLPYCAGIGGKLWDSSLILTAYLAAHPDIVRNRRAIELGSGLGLVGMSCAYLGVTTVMLTDIDDVAPLLAYNVLLNDLQDQVGVQALWWGTSVEMLEPPFDVVLMSDVVYDPTGCVTSFSCALCLKYLVDTNPSSNLLRICPHRRRQSSWVTDRAIPKKRNFLTSSKQSLP